MSMPRVDWSRFGRDVLSRSQAAGSYRNLSALHDGVTPCMVSRAVNASDSHPVGVASFLHLCACLGLDTGDYYRLGPARNPAHRAVKTVADIVKNQTVAANVSREASPKKSLTASRSLPRKGADGQSAFDESEKRENYHKARLLP